MFTHPALLRELNQMAELLRRGGEGGRSRRVVQAADSLRRLGWTAAGIQEIVRLRHEEEAWSQAGFGSEHEKALGGAEAAAKATQRLRRHWDRLADLATLPIQAASAGPRPRSPDLA